MKRPTRKEIQDYCAEKGYMFDWDRIFEYYEKKGWQSIDGSCVDDWKQAIDDWATFIDDLTTNMFRPYVEEMQAYSDRNNYGLDCAVICRRLEDNGWRCRDGQPMINWKKEIDFNAKRIGTFKENK